jgi:beta-lactamase class A
MPPTGYQPPVMSPPLPNNGMGSTVPNNGYQSPVQPPVMNPQYYYPYQR